MAMRSQRFGVRNSDGARSSEWVVMWKTNTSDVYVLTRTLGGSMKASLHASGRCHVRAPDPLRWCGLGEPPQFLDIWDIDVNSNCQCPFAVVIPEQELRDVKWVQHRDKGTIWIYVPREKCIEVAIFLIRSNGDLSSSLKAGGWNTLIVNAALPDGRPLLVAAGESTIPDRKLAELDEFRVGARNTRNFSTEQLGNLRMLVLAGANDQGTRKFVEAAGFQ